MDDYKIIVEQEHQTVMAHYEVEAKPAEGYQSEAKLEEALIRQLQGQGYEYVQVKDEAPMESEPKASFLKNLNPEIFSAKFCWKNWGFLLSLQPHHITFNNTTIIDNMKI